MVPGVLGKVGHACVPRPLRPTAPQHCVLSPDRGTKQLEEDNC